MKLVCLSDIGCKFPSKDPTGTSTALVIGLGLAMLAFYIIVNPVIRSSRNDNSGCGSNQKFVSG